MTTQQVESAITTLSEKLLEDIVTHLRNTGMIQAAKEISSGHLHCRIRHMAELSFLETSQDPFIIE